MSAPYLVEWADSDARHYMVRNVPAHAPAEAGPGEFMFRLGAAPGTVRFTTPNVLGMAEFRPAGALPSGRPSAVAAAAAAQLIGASLDRTAVARYELAKSYAWASRPWNERHDFALRSALLTRGVVVPLAPPAPLDPPARLPALDSEPISALSAALSAAALPAAALPTPPTAALPTLTPPIATLPAAAPPTLVPASALASASEPTQTLVPRAAQASAPAAVSAPATASAPAAARVAAPPLMTAPPPLMSAPQMTAPLMTAHVAPPVPAPRPSAVIQWPPAADPEPASDIEQLLADLGMA